MSRYYASPRLRSAVLLALKLMPGATPSEIHRQVQWWSKFTVKHCIRDMLKAGQITYLGKVCRRRYFAADHGAAYPTVAAGRRSIPRASVRDAGPPACR